MALSGQQIFGLTGGGIGLVGELLRDFLQLYSLYKQGLTIPEEYTYLVIQMKHERRRFLAFCQAAGLQLPEPQLADDLMEYKDDIAEIFEAMKKIFNKTKEHHARYSRHLSQRLNSGNDIVLGAEIIDRVGAHTILGLQQEIVEEPQPLETSFVDKFKKLFIINFGRGSGSGRWTWATTDAQELKGLVGKLEGYNKVLRAFLNDNQKYQQSESFNAMSRAEMELNTENPSNSAEVDSSSSDVNSTSSVVISEANNLGSRQDREIEEIYQMKIQYQKNLTADGVIRAMVEVQPMSKSDFSNLDRPLAKRTFANLGPDRVWIDWKDPEVIRADGKVDKDRIKLVVRLLRDERIKVFRSPVCLGYIQHKTDKGDTEYGLIFKLPNQAAELKSLQELINGITAPSERDKIDLCALIAESIYNFHTIGWVHKGIRSENIVFMKQMGSSIDYKSPLIIGFDLSRPDCTKSLTIKPPQRSNSEELYRHPNAQRTIDDHGFRKSYDLYSLALVLIEIALWQPIEEFLHLGDVTRLDGEQLSKIKDKLLNDKQYKTELVSRSGNTFTEIVFNCLKADQLDKPTEEDIPEALIAIKMQITENLKIVNKLRNLSDLS